TVEKRKRVVRTGVRFGMVLAGENAQLVAFESFGRAVVDVDLRHVQFSRFGYGIPVILSRHHHPIAPEVAHGLVHAAVAEGHLFGLATERSRDDLLAETDTRDREVADELVHETAGRPEVCGV